MRIAIAVLGILAMIAASRLPGAPTPTDFAVFYAAGDNLGSVDIYSLAEFGGPLLELGFDPHPFIRLPVFALWMKPFTLLPFDQALLAWRVLSITACVGFAFLWPGDRSTSAAAVFWSAGLWDAFAAGQDIAFYLFAAALCLFLVERKRYLLAGCVLSACLVKFHLFALLPVFLAERRLWRTAVGVGIGAGAQLALSTWVMPGWPSHFWASASSDPANAVTQNMFNLRGIFWGWPWTLAWELGGCLVVAAVCWVIMRRSEIHIAFAVALVGGLMMSHHAYLYDAVLCLPLALLLFQGGGSERMRILALLVILPVLYFLASVPMLVHLPKILILALLAATFFYKPATCTAGVVAPKI